jgi:hypothetical protein
MPGKPVSEIAGVRPRVRWRNDDGDRGSAFMAGFLPTRARVETGHSI